jgi:hypothetical protein
MQDCQAVNVMLTGQVTARDFTTGDHVWIDRKARGILGSRDIHAVVITPARPTEYEGQVWYTAYQVDGTGIRRVRCCTGADAVYDRYTPRSTLRGVKAVALLRGDRCTEEATGYTLVVDTIGASTTEDRVRIGFTNGSYVELPSEQRVNLHR